uniref:Peptidase S1 domain-containing protein n=1 Tax=Heliothis virescens TaxID=7102 RepID=A0A2A4JFQ7_HELVI
MVQIMFKNVIILFYSLVLSSSISTAKWHWTDDWEHHNAEMTTHGIPFKVKNPPACRKPPHPDDPCTPYHPPTPDFTAPDRRLSEVKCYESIWQLKVRHDRRKRSSQCRQKRQILTITEGKLTERGEFPSMGAIGWKSDTGEWKFMCGSTLISPKFVLTAAHCSAAARDSLTDPAPKIVRFGTRNLIKPDTLNAVDVYIKRVIVHPKYKAPKRYYDIALMELVRSVLFSADVQPSCLWTNHEITFTSKPHVTGWGLTHRKAQNTSPDLLKGEVDFIDSFTCDSLLVTSRNRHWWGLEEHQICAGKLEGGVDTCQGDSGGPLQVQLDLPIVDQGNINYVIGITSFGKGCGAPNQPGVYTRVVSFIDWIEDIVWPRK